jgi:HlyD family secretion protein
MKLGSILSTLLTFGVLGGGGWLVYDRYIKVEAPTIEYRTEVVARGRVTSTVTASGTLSPLKTVQVGSQVSGRIVELFADFNSQVKKGDVIARIDPSLLESDKARSRANLKSARASLTKANADRDNAKLIYERTKQLVKDGVAAQQEVEAAFTTWTSAKANAEAAGAAVAVANAAIETADTNLLYTTIVSPIDGVVISRDVSLGQTVAASLSAPTLFTIAEDLRAMEVHTSVAESDIGQLVPEMRVTFTVDAYPADRFRGTVFQIRNSATTLQNVVTYDAVVRVENDELKLRPGMTASVTFIVEDKRDALLVPNSALRFTPSDPKIAALAPTRAAGEGRKRRGGDEEETKWAGAPAEAKLPETKVALNPDGTPMEGGERKPGDASKAGQGKGEASEAAKGPDAKGMKIDESKLLPPVPGEAERAGAEEAKEGKRWQRGGGGGGGSRRPSSERTVWILKDGQPAPVTITIGISDGSFTEVTGGELKEGEAIITGSSGGEMAPAKSTSSPLNQSGGKGGAKGMGGGGGRRGGM